MSSVLSRLAAKAKPAGILSTIEDPMVMARLGTYTTLAASADSGAFAVLFFYYGEAVAGWATLILSASFAATWAWQALGPGLGNMQGVVRLVMVLTTANHVAVHLALGGYANSGAYFGFAISVTLIASLVLRRAEIMAWAGFTALVAVTLGFLEGALAAGRPPPASSLSSILFVIVLVGNLWMLVSVFLYFMGRYSAERERAETLLLNVLPEEVAAELKQRGTTTARRFESISVLFADVVGFTPMSADVDPEQVVARLNEVFTFFDSLVDKYGCEKIRTMGDAYMVAAGVPKPRKDHAEALASVSLEMVEYANRGPLRFRIGINSGPAIAGVIGTKKFQYDVWGDTVNLASRMETQGEPGRIQITEATYRLIKGRFRCIPHGTLEVKGKGPTPTWYLEGAVDQMVVGPGS
jgi:guanylate cyclase